jgi:thiol-disulfide isomerase/thioredoxin
MKKNIIIFLIVLSIPLFAQDKNKLIVDESSGKQMLIGICDRTAFTDTNFAWWFNPEYNNYNVDSVFLKQAGHKLNDYDIIVVMGSWCSDSRREMPRLIKILDKLNYNQQKLKLICVNRKREWPEGAIENLDIKLVPTIIFYEMGMEKGRIVESPKETLEKDILKIVLL